MSSERSLPPLDTHPLFDGCFSVMGKFSQESEGGILHGVGRKRQRRVRRSRRSTVPSKFPEGSVAAMCPGWGPVHAGAPGRVGVAAPRELPGWEGGAGLGDSPLLRQVQHRWVGPGRTREPRIRDRRQRYPRLGRLAIDQEATWKDLVPEAPSMTPAFCKLLLQQRPEALQEADDHLKTWSSKNKSMFLGMSGQHRPICPGGLSSIYTNCYLCRKICNIKIFDQFPGSRKFGCF